MAPAALDRIAETTSSEAASHTADVAREVIALLPWSGNLPAEDFTEMLTEIREAALRWRDSRDVSDLERLVAEWEATAEAYANRGLLEQLAHLDRRYVDWR
jgi:hypothetical protein